VFILFIWGSTGEFRFIELHAMTEQRANAAARFALTEGRPSRAFFYALALTLFLHLALILALPREIAPAADREASKHDELEVALEPPPPDERRYVEANPEAPENKPDPTRNFSFRDQQAADRSAKTGDSSTPRVDGETKESSKIVPGAVKQPERVLPGVYGEQARAPREKRSGGERSGEKQGRQGEDPRTSAAPPPPEPASVPEFLSEQTPTPSGEGSQVEAPETTEETSERESENRPIPVTRDRSEEQRRKSGEPGDSASEKSARASKEGRPKPKPRPQLSPKLIRGPRRDSPDPAPRRGTVAIDATFSEFGEYQRQLMTAIQAGWYREIEQFQPVDTGAEVRIRFTIEADGKVSNVRVVSTTAEDLATSICEWAIEKRSPFRPWTPEMVEVFDQSRTLDVKFIYR